MNGSGEPQIEQKTIMMRVKVGIRVNSTYTKYETFYAEEIIKVRMVPAAILDSIFISSPSRLFL